MKKVTKGHAMDYLDLITDECMSLTEWELEFIDSCAKRKDKGDFFSQKQLDIIERIWKEYMT